MSLPHITIPGDPLYSTPISPLIYGEFVEFLNDLIPGMRAERLQDRSFEGPLQPARVYPPDQDWTAPRWKPFAAGAPAFDRWPDRDGDLDMVSAAATLEFATDEPYAGRRCAAVNVASEDGRPFIAGILQEHVTVRQGEPLLARLSLRGPALGDAPVRISIGRNYGVFFKTYATAELRGVADGWQRFEAELVSDTTDPDASFAISLSAPGELRMPRDNLLGWRRDVVETVRAARPGIIRFGGSSLIYYDWRSGVGPRDRRAAFENQPWGNLEEHDVGLHEFLEFCELVGAEALICLNANSTTVDDILAEIEYCNGPADSPNGRLRAELGHPQPFGARFWQIGNEQSGAEYERRMVAYARAIRARHPELILMASYPSDTILADLSGEVAYVCPHFYDPHSPALERELRGLIERIQRAAGNQALRIAVTEWNHTGGHWGWARSWLLTHFNALNAARMFNLYQRAGDYVRVANRSNLVNSCCSGSIQTRASGLHVTPCYHVQKAYANLSGDVALRVALDAGETLDVSATRRSTDGETVVAVVNSAPRPELRVIDLPAGRADAGTLRAWTLAAPSLDAVNSFEDPERVAPAESTFQAPGRRVEYTFPAFSVTLLRK